MNKNNNLEYPLVEASPPRSYSLDSKFSFFFVKDILKSNSIQGILESSNEGGFATIGRHVSERRHGSRRSSQVVQSLQLDRDQELNP